MKRRAITLILVACLCAATVRAPEPPKPQPQGGFVVALMVTCVVVGIGFVIWINTRDHKPAGPVTLILYESADGLPERAGGKWTPIRTNYNVTLDGIQPLDFYTTTIDRNANHFYWVQVIQ